MDGEENYANVSATNEEISNQFYKNTFPDTYSHACLHKSIYLRNKVLSLFRFRFRLKINETEKSVK